MTRKILVIAVGLSLMVGSCFAQDHMPDRVNTYTDEGNGNGFRKQNFFIGGGLSGLGFGADQFGVGINPEAGYSLNRWLDAGIVANFSYNSVSADPTGYYNPDVSEKEFIYGGGAFARVYFVPFLYVTVQPEYNWTHDRQTYEGAGGATYTLKLNAPSLLCGLGYGRRGVGEGTYYIALMFDVLGNSSSPYNDAFGRALPVLRAGFDLFPHKR